MSFPLSQSPELSPNLLALPIIQEMLSKCKVLKINSFEQNGTTVLDCGVTVPGSWEAGVLFSSACLGGLSQVRVLWSDFQGLRWPAVEVVTDHPIRACMASQFAGWPIKVGARLIMGSGPARAIVHKGSLFQTIGYQDCSDIAILCLESTRLPTDEVIGYILEECHCVPENLYILVAPTASIVGSIQVAARALETGLFKLRRVGYDLGKIVSGSGICPIPPVSMDTRGGLGRTNDAIFYGATVLYNLRDHDETLRNIIKQVPACATQDYGQAYMEKRDSYKNFLNIDPDQFSPGEVWLCNLESGRSFHAGSLRADILRRSFGLEST